MLSVLLATRDRAAILDRVLGAFASLEEPPGGWQLVVVDNGSTDATPEVLRRHTGLLPLTALQEHRRGKNVALNTGLAAVEGELVVLTDDDVFPRPDWLVALAATAEAEPGYDVFGGPLVPRWEVDPPAWVLDWVPQEPVFSLTDPTLAAGPIEPHLVFGGNMAVRRAALAEHRFDPAVGPAAGHYAMGSETDLVRRLHEAGHRAFFEPRAVVEHLVRSEQLERGWILGRARRFGAGQYRYVMLGEGPPVGLVLGIPRWLLLAYLRRTRDLVRARGPEARFRAAWERAFVRGEIDEARRLHRAGAGKGEG